MKEKILVALAQVLFILALVSFLLPVQAQITQPGTPAGAILYFNATACPSGWAEYTTARGLYIVGRVSAGTLATAVGSALTDQESRTHTHSVTLTGGSGVNQFGINKGDGSFTWNNSSGGFAVVAFGTGGSAPTTASTAVVPGAFTSATAATDAPYIQLLVCQKS